MSITLPASSASRFRSLRLGAIVPTAGLALLVALGCSSTSDGDVPVGGNAGAGAASGAGSSGMSSGGSSGMNAAGSGGCAPGGGCGGSVAGSGGAGPGSGGTMPSGQGGRNEAGAGTAGGTSNEPRVHYVGRVDTSVDGEARFAWSGTGAVVRFEGTAASVELEGGQEYTVVVDGAVQPKLQAIDGVNPLASGLGDGSHTIELYRRTEAAQGESTILGFDFGAGGKLLAPPPVTRRLEFIGDSITCGYGNEGASAACDFTPQTENHYLSYAAITARDLHAELSTVAWSGKGVVCNYGDDASSCTDPLPAYYDRILPSRADSVWDFARFQPDAVVINLGTNDLSTSTDPAESTFEDAYKALLKRVRNVYPSAHILCTNGPMLGGTDLANARRYIQDAVTDLGDPNISVFELATQDGSDGFGCNSHPSLERHRKMATVVTAAIRSTLDW